MTSDIEFTQPPTSGRKTVRYDWDAITAKLRQRPGEWALLAKQGKESTANAMREGKTSGFHPANGFEVTVADTNRDARPRTTDIYVRYNPEMDTGLTAKAAMAQVRKQQKEKQMQDTNGGSD
jgi:hypothetical protein